MHASQHDLDNSHAQTSPSAARKCQKKTRVTFCTDGTFFEIQGDRKEERGFDLHLRTDGTWAELTIQGDEEDRPLPALRIFDDSAA